MIREFDRQLKFSDYLTEGAHGRTGVFTRTKDNDVVQEKMGLGWTVEQIDGGYWLRAPDISLVDITEPFRIQQLGNPVNNLAGFRLLRGLKCASQLPELIDGIIFRSRDKYSGFDYYISEGQVLEGEIRIGGSDSRINDLKSDILGSLTGQRGWNAYKSDALDFLGETRPIPISQRKLSDFDTKTAEFIKHLNWLNKALNPLSQPLGTDTLTGVVEQLPNFEVMILVPNGCYRYITSFLSPEIIDKIMLWEIHIDPNQTRTLKLLNRKLENRKCLIIDKAYTGKTISQMADLVGKKGGIPIRLGLFPKGRQGVHNSEYVLFLDRILESGKMVLESPNWAEKYYRSILAPVEGRAEIG